MNRLKSLVAKLFGLKGFIWMTATVLLWHGKISGTDWVLISGTTGLLNITQKYKGEKGGFNVADAAD